MTNVQTYPVSIPSIGIAKMVSHLSLVRAWGSDYQPIWPRESPPTRTCGCEVCVEYYAICERLARGEQP
jgi:hypothetical protein